MGQTSPKASRALLHRKLTFAFGISTLLVAIIAFHLPSVHSFSIISPTTQCTRHSVAPIKTIDVETNNPLRKSIDNFPTKLNAEEGDSNDSSSPTLSDSDSTTLGIAGVLASMVMIYSESVLFSTGCGLPAGPLGLVGAVEGVSYLSVVGLVGYSLYTKFRTGSGLPAGPGGVLGAAEGLAYLAVFAGFWVLVAQVTNYGYIPNAVPMEGGMCS
mmetsp:Transcript_27347/g.57745  ORF Transcript_27347/g.57745 Transcript_27347/m.57745 type:complete len:214 (-) Transcript_27347:2188-2829(-)